MSDPNIGRLLSKRYQLEEIIGTGAMGRVYLAKDTLLGNVPVAIKFLALSMQNEKMCLRQRFEQEAKTCALLGQKSIHIVRVMDYGVDEYEMPYYVMEYLQGQTVSQIIRHKYLSLPRFISMARHISLGLQCAHDGILMDGNICSIIHRDIKPSNMMVLQDASFGELVKILDFGIAKLLQSDDDRTKYYLGTLAYSSPEQIEGKELDNRSDIYSLGVMMFEMLTKKMPLVPVSLSFGGWYKSHLFQKPRTFAEAAPSLQIPKEIENLVMSCLAKSASDRPQTITEILGVLASVEQEEKTRKIPPDVAPKVHSVQPEKKSTVNLPLPQLTEDTPNPVSWPPDKPIADIVFPQPIHVDGVILPALWVMLPQQEIQNRLICKRYNQFLFVPVPHPMVLWITLIYNRKYGPKWLPYYLDLKTPFGMSMISLLQTTGYYRLLFFAREFPHHRIHVLDMALPSAQSERLQYWLESSSLVFSSADPQISKNLLKNEYEKLKLQILAKLESTEPDSSNHVSL